MNLHFIVNRLFFVSNFFACSFKIVKQVHTSFRSCYHYQIDHVCRYVRKCSAISNGWDSDLCWHTKQLLLRIQLTSFCRVVESKTESTDSRINSNDLLELKQSGPSQRNCTCIPSSCTSVAIVGQKFSEMLVSESYTTT